MKSSPSFLLKFTINLDISIVCTSLELDLSIQVFVSVRKLGFVMRWCRELYRQLEV
jgi:hypothetical protein